MSDGIKWSHENMDKLTVSGGIVENNSVEFSKLQEKYQELEKYTRSLNKQLYDYRELEINNLVMSGTLIGYQHTTRQILEFALESQPGQSIDLRKAYQDFFKNLSKER